MEEGAQAETRLKQDIPECRHQQPRCVSTQNQSKAAEQVLRALHGTGRRVRALDKPQQKPLASHSFIFQCGQADKKAAGIKRKRMEQDN